MRKKGPAGENIYRFFAKKLLKFHFEWGILPIDDHNPGIFSPN